MAGMVEAERRAGMSQRGRDHLVPLGDGVGDDRSRKRMPHPRLEETTVDHYRWRHKPAHAAESLNAAEPPDLVMYLAARHKSSPLATDTRLTVRRQ
jgi:hypothetical protein